ncbi:MAG: lipocalin-like domain-containing protein [Thermomicrobiales bacterium]
MDTNSLVGTWRLIAYERRDAAGNVRPVMAPDTMGYIVYTRDGHMILALQLHRSTNFLDGDIWGGTEAERSAAYGAYNSYAGTYQVRGGQVTHHVEISCFPNWIGGEQVRNYEFEGEHLSLSTAPILVQGTEERLYLVWERVTQRE